MHAACCAAVLGYAGIPCYRSFLKKLDLDAAREGAAPEKGLEKLQMRRFVPERVYLCLLFFFLSMSAVPSLRAQAVNVTITPGVSIPLAASESALKYTLGWTAEAGVDYQIPIVPLLVVCGNVAYTSAPLVGTGQTLSLISAGAGAGLAGTLFNRLHLSLTASAGYYLGIYSGATGGSLFWEAQAGASYSLLPFLSLGLGAAYSDYRSAPGSLYHAVKAWFGATLVPVPEKPIPHLQIPDSGFKLTPVFPVFYKYFDTNPLGSVRIVNKEPGTITKIVVSFLIPEFMDGPKQCAEIPSLNANESRDINLYALLKSSVLAVTEDTKVLASVRVSYIYQKVPLEVAQTQSIRIYKRTAMTWEDNRSAAAFVTANDPMINKFSKEVNSLVRDEPSTVVSQSFRVSLGIFQALGLRGLRYAVSPKGSYAEFSGNKYTVDTLQFPRQTLDYKAGDCSDLSILYAALLESVDIATAFITVPGHIYLAFLPGVKPADAGYYFSNTNDLIERDGNDWVPVEITMLKDGFLKAWKEGAREWRENIETRGFYPIRESWKTYEPVWVPGDEGSVSDIPGADFSQQYRAEVTTFVHDEVAAREGAINDEIIRTKSSPAALNKLGGLYARFGLLENAQVQFAKAAETGTYAPALVNMGNLLLLRKDMQNASLWFERAHKADPQDALALIGLARIEYEKENYGSAKSYFTQALQLKPELADKYGFLGQKADESTRATAAEARQVVQWDEE